MRVQNSNFSVLILLFIQNFFLVSLQSLNLTDLKGTYDILKPEYQHCSPVHGAVWWETDLVRKYYEFGNYEEVKEEKDEKKDFKMVRVQGDATMKLIHRLFHVVEGSFGITDSPYNPEYYFTPALIGKIIGLIETVSEESKLKNLLKTVIAKDKSFLALIETKDKELKKSGKPKLNKQQVLGYFNKEFVDALVGSIKECRADDNQLYPMHMKHAILLAYLHRKANTKNDLKEYLEALQMQIKTQKKLEEQARAEAQSRTQAQKAKEDKNESAVEQKAEETFSFKTIFADESVEKLSDEWVNDVYTEADVEKCIGELKQIGFKTPESLSQLPYETIVYAELMKLYMGALPKMVNYRTISLADLFKLPQVTFADCMDTTIRNLSNIACYDAKEKEFVLKKNFKPSEACEKFYKTYSSSFKIVDSKIHQAWTEVVQNIPYALYVRAITTDGKKSLDKGGTAFVYIHGLDQKNEQLAKSLQDDNNVDFKEYKINGKTYRLVNANEYVCYELKASVRNLIIVLNHIFGLGLFTEKDVTEEFIKPNFSEIYFPQLCEKLGWEFEEGEEKELDAKDYAFDLDIRMGLPDSDEAEFTLSIHRTHGYVTVPQKNLSKGYARNVIRQLLGVAQKNKLDFNQVNLMALFFSSLEQIRELNETSVIKKYLLFLLDLLDENTRFKIVKFLLNKDNGAELPDFVAKLIKSFPVNRDFYYQKEIVDDLKTNTKIPVVIQKEIDRFFIIAAEGIRSSDNGIQEVALDLLRVFIKKDQAINGVMAVAEKGLESVDVRAQENSLRLFKILIEKNRAFDDQALAAAERYITSKDKHIQLAVLNIFKILIKHDKAFDQALIVAGKGLESESTEVWKVSLAIFKVLVEKDYEEAFDEAIAAAEKYVTSERLIIRDDAYELLKVLVMQGEAFGEVLAIATRDSKNEDSEVRCEALNLFRALVEKNYVLKEAKQGVKRIKNSQDLHNEAEKLLKLIEAKEAELAERKQVEKDEKTDEEG